MKASIGFISLVCAALTSSLDAQEARIVVHADRPTHAVSRYLTGACIEDVNHEIYGGLYSQMVFGESFQEPPPTVVPDGFKAFGGTWIVKDGEVSASGNDGPKLVSELPAFADGRVGVEVFFADRNPGNAGLIVRVARPGMGADTFDGYEISLDPSAQILRLGRHRHNWQLIKDTACAVPVGTWITLEARLAGKMIEVLVDGRSVIRHEDNARPLLTGTVGLRPWQREARFRNFWVQVGEAKQSIAFKAKEQGEEISGMWRVVQRGNATGNAKVEKERPFIGAQTQRITYSSGQGEYGIENQGLNRWGLHFAAGKEYEGLIWARAESPTEVFAALESADGTRTHAETALKVSSADWQQLEFKLTSANSETKGRFTLKLKKPGSVVLGYAFLQPGEWGRFKRLPVRRDVAEALIDQGITVLRYGGSMVNHPEYRWKKMIGPRDRRPPHRGTWYPHSSNGWGIMDFIDFCEAAGFMCIPAFNMGESPEDMADFAEYVNGPASSEWGRKRALAGHPAPYRLRHLELGNEERVDEKYFQTFKPLAEAIWAKDPDMVIVVGDFVYTKEIRDPMNFTGSVVGLTNLAAHQKILRLAKEHNREVWFDLHVGTDGPRPDSSFAAMLSFVDALEKVADGARHKVVVFEFNAGNPEHRRALGNAMAINAIECDGRIPIATSANCLQPDGQNDNGWDQGLLFLNPSQVWLTPPGYVTRMVSRNYQPLHVKTELSGNASLDVSAKRSQEAGVLVLQVVNVSDQPAQARLELRGFAPKKATALVEELAGPLHTRNTAAQPNLLTPRQSQWPHGFAGGAVLKTFAPHSFTVLRFE